MSETLDSAENRGYQRGYEHGHLHGEENGYLQLEDDLELAAAYLRESGREKELIRLLEKDFFKTILGKSKEEKNMCETLDFVENRGYEHGYKRGYEQGYERGFEQGYQRGFEQGYQRGFEQGYQRGLQQGRQKLGAELDLAGAYLKESGRKDELIRLLDSDFRKSILAECVKLSA